MDKDNEDKDINCWDKCNEKLNCLVFPKNSDEFITCKKDLYGCWAVCIKKLKEQEMKKKI